MENDVRSLVEDSRMSRFQVVAIGVCFLLNMLDGFDVLVLAFTANSIQAEWGLSATELGVVFSSGLFGMAIGAMFLGKFADLFGRRVLIIACLLIITIGMAVSALSNSLNQLAALRVLTGIGIGGALASINIIAAEYSSKKRRGFCISLTNIGYPIGGMIGGVIAAILLPEFGWRSVFLFGAAMSALMIPVTLWRLPESMDYLLARRPADALVKLNSLLARMGHAEVEKLPASGPVTVKIGLSGLWSSGYRGATLLMWSGFFLVMATMYFVLSWTPKLLILAGASEGEGISGGLVLHLAGITGQVTLGFLTAWLALKKLTATWMGMSMLAMCLFAWCSGDLNLAMFTAAFVGFFLLGSITGLYILSPALYPAEIRTTGMGWAIGIGRIGAILSPYITGVLLDIDWDTAALFYIFAVPMGLAMLAVLLIRTTR